MNARTLPFSLKRLPFEESIGLDRVQSDERFLDARSRLDYFMEATGGIALLTGQTGVGKSCLLRWFLSSLPDHRYLILPLTLTSAGTLALWRMIVATLGERPALGKDRLYRQITGRTAAPDKTTLLVIDEAHLLDERALTDLRLLTGPNPVRPDAPPIKLLLSGQPPLGKLLTREALADLAGRLTLRHRIHALKKEQTVRYIDQRMRDSGGDPALFDDEAKALIHAHSAGLPRQINQIATLCLIIAAFHKAKTINSTTVNEAVAELHVG